jgi:hypothetical protein
VQYLNESAALQLETKDPSNELVSHFCKSVNHQVCVVICKEGEMFEPPAPAYLGMNRSSLA